jgi:hypothetical protein
MHEFSQSCVFGVNSRRQLAHGRGGWPSARACPGAETKSLTIDRACREATGPTGGAGSKRLKIGETGGQATGPGRAAKAETDRRIDWTGRGQDRRCWQG